MSFKNNTKIVLGSVSQSLDKLFFTGQITPAIPVLTLLQKGIDIAYKLGDFEKLEILQKKLDSFKYSCKDVCVYKDKLVYQSENTPPSISNNSIILPFDDLFHNLATSEVIFNYQDAENNLISNLVITSRTTDLYINGSQAQLNFNYGASSTFKAKFNKDSSKEYLIKNTSESPQCDTDIYVTDKVAYNSYLNEGYNVLDISGAKITLQKIEKELSELPNDTILYIHIDTTSMAIVDQNTLKNVVLEWWDGFYNQNPNFAGSLLINTVRNDQIPNSTFVNPANNFSTIVLGQDQNIYFPEPVECWLKTPAIGLLRQSYKEGITSFPTKQEFYQWLEGKSLVVLAFIDETQPQYHDSVIGRYPDDLWRSTNFTEPSDVYRMDHMYFLEIQPKLTYFKAVLYPIIRNTSVVTTYLRHAIAAIEGKDLTETQINSLLSSASRATITQSNWDKIVESLANNPYKSLSPLQDKGWSADFTKTSPASAVFSSAEFATELDELLTSVESVKIAKFLTQDLVSQKIDAHDYFTLKVEDNHPFNPLFSNEARIDLYYKAPCVSVPMCGEKNQVTVKHGKTFRFSPADFKIVGPQVTKMILTGMKTLSGYPTITFNSVPITPGMLPIIFTAQDLIEGELIFSSESPNGFNAVIDYNVAYKDDFNYCNEGNVFIIYKEQEIK